MFQMIVHFLCAPPARPMAAPARAHSRRCRTFIGCLFPSARFVKELRRKNLQGIACKIFRALDNDEKQYNKHTRGAVPRPAP